jgi:hypothetical protein
VPETIIHAHELRKVATTVNESAKLLSGAYQTRQAKLAPADGQGTGWSATEAARSAATSWNGFLARLASTVSSVASGMTTAANNYTDADAVRMMDKCK